MFSNLLATFHLSDKVSPRPASKRTRVPTEEVPSLFSETDTSSFFFEYLSRGAETSCVCHSISYRKKAKETRCQVRPHFEQTQISFGTLFLEGCFEIEPNFVYKVFSRKQMFHIFVREFKDARIHVNQTKMMVRACKLKERCSQRTLICRRLINTL